MRITPEYQLPKPTEWRRFKGYQVEERNGSDFIRPGVGMSGEKFALPAEVWTLLLPLDLNDLDAVMGFVEQFGIMGAHFGDYALVLPLNARLRELKESRLERREGLIHRARYGEYLDDFQLAAATVQGLGQIRRALEQSRFQASKLASVWPAHNPYGPPADRESALIHLRYGINSGLFLMRPELVNVDGDFRFEVTEPPSLFALCCLELANHVLADRQTLTCQNESCGRIFAIHEGRSKYGGHKEGITKYCSLSCTRAQLQREYRRRLKSRDKEKA